MPFWETPFRLILPYGALILLIAALLRLVPGVPRVRLRRGVMLFALYVAILGVGATLGEHAGAQVAHGFAYAESLLAILLGVHLAALLVFDLGVRALRWRSSDILHDLAIGAG